MKMDGSQAHTMDDMQAHAIQTVLGNVFPDSVFCILVRPQLRDENGCMHTIIDAVLPVHSPVYNIFVNNGVDLKKAFAGVFEDINDLLMIALEEAIRNAANDELCEGAEE